MSCQTTQVILGRGEKGGGGGGGVERRSIRTLQFLCSDVYIFQFRSDCLLFCNFNTPSFFLYIFFETLSNHHPGPGQFILRYVLAIELLIGNLMFALAKLAEMKKRLDTHVDLAS